MYIFLYDTIWGVLYIKKLSWLSLLMKLKHLEVNCNYIAIARILIWKDIRYVEMSESGDHQHEVHKAVD
jgi:hypothetical protein